MHHYIYTHFFTNKEFISALGDPIIPSSYWVKICRASVKSDQTELAKCVKNMKPHNRDTLSLIILHFQKVCKHSAENKTSPTILARVFADSLARYTPSDRDSSVDYFNKKENQISVIIFCSLS